MSDYYTYEYVRTGVRSKATYSSPVRAVALANVLAETHGQIIVYKNGKKFYTTRKFGLV